MSYRLVFMGTPEFAEPSLLALSRTGHQIVGVVTQPDRPKGRGRIVTPPPVKAAALASGYPVIQPETVKTRDFERLMRDLRPDFFIVIAFGHVLSPTLLSIPTIAAVNAHASLLPKYRGAAPIQWALIQGEAETGVTTMLMDQELDAGDILMVERLPIEKNDTSLTLHQRLAEIAAGLLVKTLNAFADGTIRPQPQDHSQATYAPLLKKETGRIPWALSAAAVASFIRGVTPWPGAFSFHEGQRIRIFAAEPCPQPVSARPGEIIQGFSNELRVATGDGYLSVLEIQGGSGKRLPIRDYLRGHALTPGGYFE